MEHKSVSEGLGEVGGVAKKGRGVPQSGVNILQGGDTGGNTLCIGYLGNFSGDGEDGGGVTHRVSEADHGEAGADKVRPDMGDA